MISRITIVVVAASLVGMLDGPLRAQSSGYLPTPVGFAEPLVNAVGPQTAGASMGGASSGAVSCDSRFGKGRSGVRNVCRDFRPCHYWISADSLLWWGKGRTMPALVTTSPQGTIQNDAGVLGETGTQILFGNGKIGNELAAGARVDFGFWLDPCETLGVGAKVWGVQGDRDGIFATASGGAPILARPFYNVVLDQEDSLLVAFPGLLDNGTINVETSSDVIGSEAYLRTSLLAGRGYHLDLMGGYHFVRLDDDLLIRSNSVNSDAGGAVPVGTIFDVTDAFDARNEFHGGEIGVVGEMRYDCWTLSGLGKVSVGNMRQEVDIDGSTVVTPPVGAPATSAGGLLALPTNMGSYSQDRTAFVPEVGVTLAYKWRKHVRLTIGYSAIYWSSVVLSGDQIDRNINTTQMGGSPLIGPQRPAFDFQETEYWMHGLNLGATWVY